MCYYKKDEIPKLTPAVRNQIMAQEFLTIEDLQILLQRSYTVVKKVMDEVAADPNSIWNGFPALRVSGSIHIQDYIRHFGLDPARYIPVVEKESDA